MTRLKEEKAELKERNEFLEEKMRKDKEQHKREERLLHSAFYEVRNSHPVPLGSIRTPSS